MHTCTSMRYSGCDTGVFKTAWTDSSPLNGYDWLWSQYHEVKNCNAIEIFDAVVELHDLILAFVEDFSDDETVDDEDKDDQHKSAKKRSVPLEPEPQWVPLADIIEAGIHEHINPPAALGSGARSLADKASAETHKWAMQTPVSRPLFEEAETYEGHTSDMGTELGLPDLELMGPHESLLGSWMTRGVAPQDLDVDDLGNQGAQESEEESGEEILDLDE